MDGKSPQDENAAKVLARLDDLRAVGGDALVRRVAPNFRSHLVELISSESDWSREEIHRLLGLAAMLGFDPLEALLRALEDAEHGDGALIEAAREAMQRAIVLLDRLKD